MELRRGDPVFLHGTAWSALHSLYKEQGLQPLDEFLQQRREELMETSPLGQPVDILPTSPSSYSRCGLTTWMVTRAVLEFRAGFDVLVQIKGPQNVQETTFTSARRMMGNVGIVMANKKALRHGSQTFLVTSIEDRRPINSNTIVFNEDAWMDRLIRRVKGNPFEMIRFVVEQRAFAEEEEFLMELDKASLEHLRRTRPDVIFLKEGTRVPQYAGVSD